LQVVAVVSVLTPDQNVEHVDSGFVSEISARRIEHLSKLGDVSCPLDAIA